MTCCIWYPILEIDPIWPISTHLRIQTRKHSNDSHSIAKLERKKSVNTSLRLLCTFLLLPAYQISNHLLDIVQMWLSAARLITLYTHIVLKSIAQPHCPPFCIKKLKQIHILVRLNADIIVLKIFGLNSIQSMTMWYPTQKALFGWMNNWIVCKV